MRERRKEDLKFLWRREADECMLGLARPTRGAAPVLTFAPPDAGLVE